MAVLITGVGFSSLGYVPTYALLVMGCLVCGIGIPAYHPDAAKLVNGLAGYNPGQGMSIFSFGGNIGFAIGPITLTLAVNHFGNSWNWYFLDNCDYYHVNFVETLPNHASSIGRLLVEFKKGPQFQNSCPWSQ